MKRNYRRRFAGAAKVAGLLLAGLLPQAVRAAAPPNDNWANATVLVGDFGTTNGSNIGATREPGEPSHAGLAPKNSIWYRWTATADAPVEFDTFNSKCDTVLAVYTGTNVANLSLVVANDDINTTNPENPNGRGSQDPYVNNPYLGPSGVKFNARHGITYYIAVDGTFKKGSSPAAQGPITLSWAYNPSGVFRLSKLSYVYSETESDNPVNGTVNPSARGARITVTRLFGSSGKVIVNFGCLDGTALADTDYTIPANTNIIFEDFEMSKSLVIPLIDDGCLAGNNPGRRLQPGCVPTAVSTCSPNRTFNVILTGVQLDPLEDPTVLSPPRLETIHTNSTVTMLDFDEANEGAFPFPLGCPYAFTIQGTNGVANFERAVFRVNEGVGTASILVYRVGGDPQKSGKINYCIDTTQFPNLPTNTRDNTFDLQADSDYASPDTASPPTPPANYDGPASLEPDFFLPYPQASYGSLNWGAGDYRPKAINITITNDTIPEFNEDLFLTLFQLQASDLVPGNVDTATVTILYDDYPAGALDDGYNPDFDISTSPPNNSQPGADNTVYSLVVQSNDNKTVIVGNFSSYDITPRYGIARIDPDGQLDTTFDPGDGVPVKDPINPSFLSSLAATAGGKYVIGGNFPSYNGTPRYNIAQVNADGSLDTSFNPGLGANGTVWAIAALANGQVLIGGEFSTVGGSANLRSRIARLNADGSLDPSFDPGTNGPNGTINAIVVAPDGTIYIGGDFNSVGGLARPSVAQLNTNGLVLTNFSPVAGANGPVYALALQSDGRLLVGGAFSSVEFQSRNNIARYMPDGSLDNSFYPGAGANDTVYAITLQSDGRIYLGGLFTAVNQTRRMALARLFATGEVDTGFLDTAYNQFAGLHHQYFNPYVNPKDFLFTMGIQPDGNVMIGGSFAYVGGGRFTANVTTNSPAPMDDVGPSRANYRIRNNVARLLGGDTVGPGSMGLVSSNYAALENMGFLFIKAVRANGSLGLIESTFSIPSRPGSDTIGIAQSGVDYVYNRVNPRYGTSYNGNREMGDGIYGTNNLSTDAVDASLGNPLFTSGLDDITVTINNLPGYQGDRTALFQLDVPSCGDVFFLGGANIPLASALASTIATLRIQEINTSPGVIGFSSPTFAVNENGTNAAITITRTNGSVGPVSFRFATTNGTAFSGIDYFGLTNTITFRDGQTGTNVSVPIINHSDVTPDTTVNLYLASPGNGATLGLSNAVLTIINVNFLPGHLNFTSTSYSTNETAPAAVFPVTRAGGNLGVVDVQYATSNLTAVVGVNFSNVVGSLHWDDGDTTTRSITVPLLRDGLVTPNLQFSINLFNPSIAGVLGPRSLATNTIINADFFGNLQFSAPSYLVNENGGFATVTVIRTGGSAQTINANFTTLDGPFAYKFINYIPTNGTLVFGPGVVSRSFTVPLRNDLEQDPPPASFYFAVQLTNPPSAGAVIGSPSFATVNIIDAYSFNQPPGLVDPSFNPDAAFDDDIYALALQPAGQILAAGNFSNVNGQPVNRVIRLNADGTFDTSFLVNTLGGANDAVRAILNQSDTRIVVGGVFTTFNGVARNAIARLNFDGNLDTGFNPGSGASGTIFALAETFAGSARKLYAGGSFTTFNGALLPGVVRLNDDGTVDGAFNTGQGVNGTVYALAVYPTNSAHAGQVVIAGDFTLVNGTPRNRIARLNADGSLDAAFDSLGLGVNNTIRALVLQTDGSVVIGGAFTNVNGVAVNRIARLKAADGSLDMTFTVGPGADDLVYYLALQPDNRIVVGGAFTHASGVTRNRITRLMPNGVLDPTINFGAGADNYVGAIVIQPDSKLVIGGGFTHFAGLSRPHLARIYGGSVTGSGAFQFDSATYQGDETSTNVQVTVLRTGGTSGPMPDGSGLITVEFQTVGGGTAVPGINYSNVDAILDFPAGETVQTVLIPVLDNLQITPDLTVNLALVNPTPPATLGNQPTAVLTILNDNSSISFSSLTYSRAEDAVDGAATIELDRIGSTRNIATVAFMTTTNGTAIPNFNYTPVTNTVTFLPGQTQQFVNVPIFHTPVAEGDKTVSLLLANSQGALLLNPFQATLTIIDVDQAPGSFVFSQTNYVVGEGDGNALISVVRTNGHSGIVSVDFATIPGTATPGLQYNPTNGTLNFGDGETAKSFSVPILQGNQIVGTENLFLQLTNATGGASIPGPNPVQLAILGDIGGISFSTNSFINAVYVVSETNGSVTVDVFRLNTTNGTIQVSYYTSNATAIAGTDYSTTSGTLTFRPGETRSSVSIPILRDPLVTGDRTFTLNLANAINVSNPTQAVQLANPTVAFIVVNDVDTGLRLYDTNSPAIPTAQYGVLKTGTNITITVVRTNASTGPVGVNFTTIDGTATAPTYYGATSGFLVFTNGQVSNSFTVAIVNNPGIQGNLNFNVALANPTNLAGSIVPQLLLPSSATVTITDNTAGLSFSSPTYDANQNGSSISITVVRSGFLDSIASVNYATQDGTASSGQGGDYDATSGTLTFTNGQTTTNFVITLHNTTLIKPDRTVLLKLSNPSPGATAILASPSAATLTIHNVNGSIVIPAGVALLSESNSPPTPPNGAIDPGETVTLLFALRNAGGTNTADLQATLTNSPGVTPLDSVARDYGRLVTNGPAVSRPFTFTATGTNGQRIIATLLLSDNGHAVGSNGTASFTFTIGTNSSAFTNSGQITINAFAPATPYPSTINVANIDGVVSKTVVTFNNLNHTYPSDIDALLQGPGTTNAVLLMANAGDGDAISMVNVTFDDAATNALPKSSIITNGSYHPTAYFPVAVFATPAPPAPSGGRYPTALTNFNASNPNGAWSLFVIDSNQGDSGVISNGWSLNLTFINPVPANADLALAMTGPATVVQGSNITYSLTVTNFGPTTNATGVIVSDLLPSAAAYVTNLTQISQGAVTTNGAGLLTWNIGTLGTNGVASLTFTLAVPLSSAGALTNSATVSTATTDLNPANDTGVLVTAIVTPSADLVLSLVGAPDPVLLGGTVKYTITASNGGPATASAVAVTDTLPPTVMIVSNWPANATLTGTVISFPALGDVTNNGAVTVFVYVKPLVAGIFTNNASCTSITPALHKLDRFASVKTIVEPMLIAQSGNSIVISWPVNVGNFQLQSAANLKPPVTWVNVTVPAPLVVGGTNTVTIPIGSGPLFFRLQGQGP